MTRSRALIAAAAMVFAPALGGSLSAASPPSSGTISIEARAAGADDPSMRSFVIAAGEALGAKGFTILPDAGHAAYVAELTLTRVDLGTSKAKALTGSSSSITPGVVPGAVGTGIKVPLATAKSRLVALQQIRLEIRIRKRGEENILWDGSALTVRPAGTRKGGDDIVAADLSEAVLRSYPAEVRDVIGVP